MHRHGIRLGCVLLLSNTLLPAQELVGRDGPLALRGGTAYDIARNRLVVVGDLRDIHEGDGQRWFRRPMRTTGWLGGKLEYHAATRRTIGFGIDTGFVPSTVEWDGAVWRQLSPATTPPARVNSTMAYDSARARVVMFGGTNQTLLNDTWEWDGSNWLPCPAAVAPSPRSYSAMAFDSARGVTVLFGGAVFQNYDAETWEWNGATWQQVVLPVSPSARSGHAMAFDATRGRTVMFGGGADLWEYDGNAWTQVPMGTPWPAGRFDPSLHAEPGGGVVLTGGFMTPDAWSWNGTSWTARTGLPAMPSGVPTLVAMAMATDPASGGVLMFGGYSTSTVPVANDTWRWDGWTWNQVASGGPPARVFASAWSHGNMVYLFGGQGPGPGPAWRNDTWAWNGTAWSAVTPASSPPARYDTAVVYDAARGEAVLFSGRGQSPLTSDTWTFDGSTWQLRSPPTNPPPREKHALAYDPVRSRVVMFGGAGLAGMGLDDTWEWDGTDWIQVLTATRPPGSYGVGMAYDARRNRIVMAQSTPLGILDMWSYDGVDWAPLPLVSAPSLQQAPMLSGWPANRGVLLFDGKHLRELVTNAATAAVYGTACGSGPALVGRTAPRVGDAAFGCDVVGAPAGAPLLLVGAIASANVPVGPCSLLVAPGQATLFALAGPTGFLTLNMPLPNAPTWLGVELFLQAAALQPATPAGFVMSPGLHVTIGD